MIANFDYFNNPVDPKLFICNPDKTILAPITRYTDSSGKISLKVNACYDKTSDLSVAVYKYVGGVSNRNPDSNSSIADCYQYIDVYRQIHVENLGYFVITSCTECNDGLDPYYEVTAQSCEIELNNKQIKLNAGIYKFYDALYPSETVMGKILELCPSWKLGSLPQNIQGKFRTFDDTKESVYGFLSTTLEKAFGCIIDFDIENRIINVIDSNYEIPSADILLDFDNILTNVKINQSKENIITNLTVTGGNDLDISEVNPTGEDYIVDFSYYKNLNWMSQNLIDAIDAWEKKIANNNTIFNSILANLKQHQTELESLDTQLLNLQDDLKALESQKSDLASKNQDYSNIQSQIDSKNTAINSKNNEIVNKQSVISSDYSQLHTLQNSLRLENNFTDDQFEELNHYIFQNEYKNDNITVDKDASYSVKQEAMVDLYFDGLNKLHKLCQPASDFEIDATNFLLIKDFDQYRKRFDLGKAIDIKLSPNNIVRFMVLQYAIDYDSLLLTIKLSNQLKINDRFSAYQDLYNKVTATSNTISKSKDIWNYPVKSGSIAEFDEFRSGVLNATLNKVISSDNEEIAIDNTGIHGRSKNSITGKYEPEQLWINKNNIMFSDDGFKSAKMAVGKMQLPNGTWVYGFNGDAILAGTIDAARLNLTDYAKFTDLSTAGSTTINGSNITTGKIQSNNGKVYFDLNNAIISASQLVSKDAVNNALKIGHVYTNTPDTGWGMALYDERSRMVYTAYNVYDWYVNISSTIPMQIFSGEWGGTHSGVNLHSDSFEIFTSPDGGYSYGVTCLSDGSIEIAGSSIVVNGNFSVLNGSKNAVVTTKDYGDRAISAYETAEYYFGDIGYGKIEDGECRIDIDPVFAQCVNTEIDYHVFLTCVGDAANIYVAEMNKDYFVVKSDKDIKFSYEIKAKRLGYEDVRLKEFELKKNNTTV